MIKLKLFCFLVITTLTISSCSNDERNNELPLPDNIEEDKPIVEDDLEDAIIDTVIGFDSDLNLNIDISKVSVVSLGESTSFQSNRTFVDNSLPNEYENAPVFFEFEDEVLFGYFKDDLESQEIGSKTLIKFFLKSFSSLASRGIENQIFEDAISDFQNLPILEKEMLSSINSLESPLLNEKFTEQFVALAKAIISMNYDSISSKRINDTFQFDYTRNGEIEWPKKAPVFAALGLSITNTNSGEKVMDDRILDHLGINLFDKSTVYFLYNLITDTKYTPLDKKVLDSEGEHEIHFTNGKGNTTLDNLVKQENADIFASHCVSLISPFSLRTLKGISTDCSDAITSTIEQSSAYILDQLAEQDGLTVEELLVFLEQLSLNMFNSVVNCFPDIKFRRYIALGIKFAIKRLSLALDTSELLLFKRDFLDSSISSTELRYFKNGISVGKLQMTNVSDLDLLLFPESEFDFTAEFEEVEVFYELKKDVFETDFVQKEEMRKAGGLKFNYEIGGDISSLANENSILTDSEGKFLSKFKSGNTNSDIRIYPNFITPDLEDILVKVSVDTNMEDDTVILEKISDEKFYGWPSEALSNPMGVAIFYKDPNSTESIDKQYSIKWTLTDEGGTLENSFISISKIGEPTFYPGDVPNNLGNYKVFAEIINTPEPPVEFALEITENPLILIYNGSTKGPWKTDPSHQTLRTMTVNLSVYSRSASVIKPSNSSNYSVGQIYIDGYNDGLRAKENEIWMFNGRNPYNSTFHTISTDGRYVTFSRDIGFGIYDGFDGSSLYVQYMRVWSSDGVAEYGTNPF